MAIRNKGEEVGWFCSGMGGTEMDRETTRRHFKTVLQEKKNRHIIISLACLIRCLTLCLGD